MSEQHGETPASNRGWGKDGRGALTRVPALTLLIPNNKARHRSTGNGIVWRYQVRYWQNNYYLHVRPIVRVILKRIKLRK